MRGQVLWSGRAPWLIGLSLIALGALGYRIKHHFGLGLGRIELVPQINERIPDDTPLPPFAPRAQTEMQSQWLSFALPGQRAARRALWLRPRSWSESQRGPLVIVLHGDGGDAAGFRRAFPYEDTSGDFAQLLYPEGLRATWDTGSREGNMDVLFLDRLIEQMVQAHGAEPSQVFLTGYSSGGFLAQVYACQRPGKVRAFASHEGGAPYNQAERWPNGATKCPGQKPVAALSTHGQKDYAVTFKSGQYAAYYWAAVNGCDVGRAHRTAYPQCYAFDGCGAGAPSVFCDIPELGHWIWDRGAEASLSFFQALLK